MLEGSGISRFRLAVLAASFALATAARASDCDGDGAPDEEEVAAGAPDCNGNGIPDACDLIGTPFGVAEAARTPFGVFVFGLDAADLDGDGAGDLAACANEGVYTFLQRPAGEFEVRLFPSPGCGSVRASDLDGDGDLDLALAMNVMVVLGNAGAGVFNSTAGHGAPTGHMQITPVDMDADGDVDLVSITRDGTGVSILFNAGDGTYPSQLTFGAELFPSQIAVSDLDADGDPDVAVLSQAFPEVALFSNTDGRGSFGTPTRIPLDFPTSGLLVAELDGSGPPELLVYSFNPGRLCILRREGAGFTRDCRLTGGDNVLFLHASDLTSDGIADVLLIETALTCATPSASLHTNVAAGGLRRPMTADLGFVSGPVIVSDVVGDSIPEIIIAGQGSQPEHAIRILRLGPGPALPDCDRNDIPDECDLAGSDWNFNLRIDACEIEEGLADCDANGIPDAQDPDCDRNGVSDACDIAAGVQQDLDSDGVPDGCEPLTGSLVDCNGNGISDEIDLESATSADCNANLVPDECDIRRYQAAPRIRLPVDGIPLAVVLPDLDGSGGADAAVLRAVDISGTQLKKRTSLLLYRNGASWSPGRDFPAGILPLHLRSGDLDGNGLEDIITLNSELKCLSPGFASAFLNRGEGDLEPPGVFGQGLRPTSMATGDLDGDGDLDAALTGEEDGHAVFVFLNDGSGRFERVPADIGLPGMPTDLVASDLDGDSGLDLAVGLQSPASVAIFRHTAGASFTAGPVLRSSFAPVRLAAADLEGRGSMDIVSAAGPFSANAAFLFENDTGGNFGEERIVALPLSAKTVLAFDADADGTDDLAVAGPFFAPDISPDGEDLVYLRSLGGREFDLPVILDRRTFVSGLATGDTDADGDLDIAVANPVAQTIRFFTNRGEQGFEGDFRHTVGGGINALIASDLDGDGYEDVIIASGSPEDITVLPGKNGRIAGRQSIALEFVPQAVAAADLDGDGDGDLIAGGGTNVQALLREETGSYLHGPPAVLSSTPKHLVASDLDGDGDLDVATANLLLGSGFNDNASFLANDGAGGLAAPRNFGIGMHPSSLCAADLDSDGDTDLVAASSSGLSFLWNGGAGDFSRADTRPSAETRGLLAVDLDGNGLKELIGARLSDVSILENGGGGAFEERSIPVRGDAWPIEANWYGFAGADLEEDGDLDLVLADPTNLFMLENRGGAFPRIPEVHRWRPQEGSGGSGCPCPDPSLLIALPHLDGNGHRDLAFGFPFGNEVVILHDREPVSRDVDRNGVPDECGAASIRFRRGETNGDALVDLSDAISVLRWLFAEGIGIPCLEAADGNDDGRVDLSDPVWLLRHLFLGASPPYDPFLSCGLDPTPDALGCVSFPECEG